VQLAWLRELLWMADHWEDVLSDMSAIHRLRRKEALGLTPPEFFSLAVRLPHYAGAVQHLVMRELQQRDAAPQAPSSPARLHAVPDGPITDPTEEQVDAIRERARLKRFNPREYGEHKVVPLDTAMREVRTGA